jgi:hypothetical protein
MIIVGAMILLIGIILITYILYIFTIKLFNYTSDNVNIFIKNNKKRIIKILLLGILYIIRYIFGLILLFPLSIFIIIGFKTSIICGFLILLIISCLNYLIMFSNQNNLSNAGYKLSLMFLHDKIKDM